MVQKIGGMIMIWGGVIVGYIFLAFSMPAHSAIVNDSLTSLNASANMTNFPGTYEAVAMFPVYVWFIPFVVGMVATVIHLREEIINRIF